jgi:hypothetical protein
MSEKRKHNTVKMQDRLNILQRLDKGESVQSICTEFNVGKSTVYDWRKNRKSIEDFCMQIEIESVLSTRSTLKKPHHELLDDALWLWFMQERRRGTPINGPILKEKAVILHSKLGEKGNFSASDGWLTRWKKRHGVHFLGVCGEKLSADQPAANDFSEKLKRIIEREKLTPEQVYNIDETGLNYKLLPNKTFATPQEKSASGFKVNKERITVALCSNATGTHKMPLFVIGMSAKPRVFKNLNMSSLPVYYRSQKSAWMDSYLFKEWFVAQFVPSVKEHLTSLKLPVKAVLVLDNAPTHPEEGLECDGYSDIKLLYMPPNVTSIAQPMDQGVIECFKRKYRRKLLSEILDKMDGNDNAGLIQTLKTINIKDVIYIAAKSYDEIPSSTFTKSWRKLWPDVETLVEKRQEDNPNTIGLNIHATEPDDNHSILKDLQRLPDSASINENDVVEWISRADDELANEILNDDEIVDVVLRQEEEKEEDDDEGDSEAGNGVGILTHAEGRAALELATTYVEQQPGASAVDVMFLRKWRDYAFKKTVEVKKQKKITDFF